MPFDASTAKVFDPITAKSFDPETATEFDPSSAVAEDAAEPSPIGRALSAIKSLPHDIGQLAVGAGRGAFEFAAMPAAAAGTGLDMLLHQVTPLGNRDRPGLHGGDRFTD